MARGGYREPENPAPVSGPGRLSQRTDGGPADSQPVRRLPNAGYGESKSFQDQQRGADVAQSEPMPPDTSSIVPLSAPSGHPDQPIMAGAVQPGAPAEPAEQDLLKAASWLPVLKMMASRSQATQASRQMVRQLEARLNGRV